MEASMLKMIKLLADDGHNVITDQVFFGDHHLKRAVQEFADHTVYFVKVTCALDMVKEREILRGDRTLGLGNDQFDKVHGPTRVYDLTVDTTDLKGFVCARAILESVQSTPHPKAFEELRKRFGIVENAVA